MTLHYVEHTITKDGVVVSYEKPNFNSKNDAIEYYNKLWMTHKDDTLIERYLSFTATKDNNEIVNVNVGTIDI